MALKYILKNTFIPTENGETSPPANELVTPFQREMRSAFGMHPEFGGCLATGSTNFSLHMGCGGGEKEEKRRERNIFWKWLVSFQGYAFNHTFLSKEFSHSLKAFAIKKSYELNDPLCEWFFFLPIRIIQSCAFFKRMNITWESKSIQREFGWNCSIVLRIILSKALTVQSCQDTYFICVYCWKIATGLHHADFQISTLLKKSCIVLFSFPNWKFSVPIL